MSHRIEDYTFSSLNGEDDVVTSLAYAVALVDAPENRVITSFKTAKFVLSYVYDSEEQCGSVPDLLSTLQGPEFPDSYSLQTPVMLTRLWSPISAMLERGWEPIALSRESRRMSNCASGVWEPKPVVNAEILESCMTDEDLFWHVMAKVVEKAILRGRLVSIIAKPGWSYNHGKLQNLTLEEAEIADRVIWQRTPIIVNQ